MKNFVSVDWLYENIDNENLKIFDVRSDLFDKEYGKKVFEEGHIKNARFIDLEEHLSGPKGKHGGRHPLPNLEEFTETVRSLGIGSDTIVIAYDEQKIASASRFCFMLRLIGHEKNFDIEELKERFSPLKGKKDIIIYCGSGIDATFNFFTLDELGIKARVYIGSFSDWITYDENEVIVEVC